MQTFTVATNAAGQAAAAAINPLASGAVQIQVAAAFQGQTAAATIVQTNVLTAAQAASAAGASSAGASSGSAGGTSAAGGGAAGGGGGISGTTVGIVGAAAAGSAIAATQVGGGETANAAPSGPRNFTGAFSFTINLTFQGCQRVETWTGTLMMTLNTAEPLTGDARINSGTNRVDSVTCTGGPQLGATGTFGMRSTPITGSTASLGFNSVESGVFPPGPNEVGGTNTQGFAFSGALNGAEVSGTLVHTRRIDSNGSAVPGTGSASVTVTLR